MESTRKKSCRHCRIAKTRCSLAKPTCSRCESKRLTCNYESRRNTRTPEPTIEGGMFHSWLTETNPRSPPAFREDALPSSHFSELPDFDTPLDDSFGTDAHLWNDAGPRNSPSAHLFDIILDGQAPDHFQQSIVRDALDSRSWSEVHSQNRQKSSSGPNISINPTDGGAFVKDFFSAMRDSERSVTVEWPILKDFSQYPNILNRKCPKKISALTVGNFLWAAIESFATGFIGGQFPPFIHRKCSTKEFGGPDDDSAYIPEPLANCKQIIIMFSNKTPSSMQLLWKTLVQEVQRLYDEASLPQQFNCI